MAGDDAAHGQKGVDEDHDVKVIEMVFVAEKD